MFYKIFLFFCIFLPFQFALNPSEGIDLAVVRIIIPAFFLVFLIILFKKKDFLFLKNKVVSCFLLFIVLAFVSLIFSHNLSWSFRKLAFILSFAPLFFVALYFFIQPKNWRPTIIALVASGSLISFLAIIQFLLQFIFGIDPVYNFLAKNITPFFLGKSFSQTVLAYPSWLVNSEGITYMRAVANFPDPHMLAYYLGMLAPWAVVLWSTSKNHKLLFFAAFLLIIVGDIMTFTRGSYIALIASSFVVLPIVSRKTAGKLLFGVFVFIILLITMPHGPVTGRFASSFDTQEGSNQARLSNWEQAAAIIVSHPLGVGIGNYSLSVKSDAAYREPIYAHNLYLDIAAELGIPALLVFISILFFSFKGFWQVARKNAFFVAGIASLTIFSVHSLVENPLYSVHVLPLFLLMLALGAELLNKNYEKNFSINNLFLLTILGLPLYLVRLNIFGLPTNILELLAVVTVIIAGIKNKNALLAELFHLPKFLIISLIFIFSGLLLSLLSNDAYKIGLGFFKGWFLVPFLFSFVLYVSLKKENFSEKIYLCLYFSALMVSLISLGYKLLGMVTYDNRLQAFYSSPNYLAMFLVPGIFFGVYFLIKYALQKKIAFFLFYAFSLICLIIALYLTYSYGAWIAVSGSLLLVALFRVSNKKIAALAIAMAVIFSCLIFQTNAEKFSGIFSERSSLASRLTIWKSSLMMLKENPLLGIGPGNFQNKYLEFQKYFPPYLEWAVPQPHNLFLAFWLQTGIIGLLGFFLLLFLVFKMLFELIKNKKDALLAAPLLGFFIYTVLHGLIDTPFWKNDLSFLFWICVFVTFFICTILESEPES